MPVLKSTYDAMVAKYEAEAGKLVKRIEALADERNTWRGEAESYKESYEESFERWGEAQRERDLLRVANAELEDTVRIARDGVLEIRVLADTAGRHCAHQYADLQRMTHERDEALSCMNVYGLVIEQLLDEGDELRVVVVDLQSEIGALVDCQMVPDVDAYGKGYTDGFTDQRRMDGVIDQMVPDVVAETWSVDFVVDLGGTVTCAADYVGQAA